MYSYEMTIDVGMLFRRMYCCKCGTKLKRRSLSHLYRKGEVGYPKCKNITTYEE